MEPETTDRAIMVENAMECMRKARYWLRAAKAPRALAKLERALKSADGARRHAHLDAYRKTRE
jgi:hypothetical protein